MDIWQTPSTNNSNTGDGNNSGDTIINNNYVVNAAAITCPQAVWNGLVQYTLTSTRDTSRHFQVCTQEVRLHVLVIPLVDAKWITFGNGEWVNTWDWDTSSDFEQTTTVAINNKTQVTDWKDQENHTKPTWVFLSDCSFKATVNIKCSAKTIRNTGLKYRVCLFYIPHVGNEINGATAIGLNESANYAQDSINLTMNVSFSTDHSYVWSLSGHSIDNFSSQINTASVTNETWETTMSINRSNANLYITANKFGWLTNTINAKPISAKVANLAYIGAALTDSTIELSDSSTAQKSDKTRNINWQQIGE